MDSPESQTNRHENNPGLDLPKLRTIYIQSFYLSQGEPYTQRAALYYVHCLHPEWKIDNDMVMALADHAHSTTRRLSDNKAHKYYGSPDGSYTAIGEAEAMQKIFNNQPTGEDGEFIYTDKDQAVRQVLNNMIDRDKYFLFDNERRPNKSNPQPGEPYSPMKDPYLSHFCYYILGNHNLGIPEYDELFSDIRNFIGQLSRQSLNKWLKESQLFDIKDIKTLIKINNTHHTGSQVVWPLVGVKKYPVIGIRY